MVNRKKFAIAFFVFLVLVGILGINLSQHLVNASVTNESDAAAIESTFRTYLLIKAEAEYSLDDSRLTDVVANDPHGGKVDEIKVKAVRWLKGNPNLKREEVGFLDINQARFAYCRAMKKIYDQKMKKNELPTPTPIPYEPSVNPIPEELKGTKNDPRTEPQVLSLDTIPEFQALMDETGFQVVCRPLSPPQEIVPEQAIIQSITTKRDIAYLIVDYQYGRYEYTLVKKGGKWYMIGEKMIENFT